MAASPQISVIVPVFNAGKKLISSIESLLKQTLKDLEIIIVNDASTDASGAVIDKLASVNANVVPVHLNENKGVHEARLAGIKRAKAPWIGFLDADDFARPTMFEAMLKSGSLKGVDIVVCGSYRVTTDRSPIAPKLRFKRSMTVYSNIFERFCRFDFGTGMLWNKLYRREVITPYADMHFPWRQSINEDLLLNLGCFYNAKSVHLMNEVLHEYVLNDDSATSKNSEIKAYVETYRALALAIKYFGDYGEHVTNHIVNLYRIQLSSSTYLVDDVSTLADYEESLSQATRLICDNAPLVLAQISARKNPATVGAKLAIRSLLLRLLLATGIIYQLPKT